MTPSLPCVSVERVIVALALLLVVALDGGAAVARNHAHHETRIPHEDGTGTSTIVEVPKGIPGTDGFVRASPAPIPQPGELMFAPTLTPTPSPVPDATPRR